MKKIFFKKFLSAQTTTWLFFACRLSRYLCCSGPINGLIFEVMALEPIISSTWLNILYILFGVHGGATSSA
uniref:Uncharacterized protein n=1 Tax=Klebsiella pneumoniae TaxID=573 RepID=A0A8B0SRJ3_KLEPN|nr:hypothetical protein [Klebsiella pneumoniae]